MRGCPGGWPDIVLPPSTVNKDRDCTIVSPPGVPHKIRPHGFNYAALESVCLGSNPGITTSLPYDLGK